MTHDEAEAIRERSCTSKVPYGKDTARSIAREQIAYDGSRPLAEYRCVFGDHWHVGHVLSVEGMKTMADAVRVLSGNGPGSDPGNVPRSERRAARRAAREPQSPAPVLPVRSGPEILSAAPALTEALSRVAPGIVRLGDAYQDLARAVTAFVEMVRADDDRRRTVAAVAFQRRRRR